MNEDTEIPLIAVGVCISFVLGLALGLATEKASWQENILKHNSGYYNATNGQFYLKNFTNTVDVEQK